MPRNRMSPCTMALHLERTHKVFAARLMLGCSRLAARLVKYMHTPTSCKEGKCIFRPRTAVHISQVEHYDPQHSGQQ